MSGVTRLRHILQQDPRWALLAFCLFLFIWQARWRPAPLELQLEIKTERGAELQLIYDSGHGFRQQGSFTTSVDSRDTFQILRFPIEAAKLKALRLAQVNGAGPIELRGMRLTRFGGRAVEITAANLNPLFGLEILPQPDGITRLLPIAGVQSTNLGFNLPRSVSQTRARRWLDWLVPALLCAGAGAFLWLADRRGNPWEGALTRPTSDWSRRAIIGFLITLYVAASVLKFNGSSTARWRIYADHADPAAAVLLGVPKDIRSDEWLVHTPWILSQKNHEPSWPVRNENVGSGVSTLLTNLPAHHWSMIFRPQMWAFFVTDVEQGFAFYWNFKWFALLLGAFLFLELLTRRDTFLAAAGALLLFFSPFVQWWWSTPTAMPEIIALSFWTLWSAAMVFRSSTRRGVVAASVLFVWSLAGFVFCCYPRFQIPLAEFGALIAIAAAISSRRPNTHVLLRSASAAAALLASIAVVAFWYSEVADGIRLASRLIYPGQIFCTGGDYPRAGLIAPFLAMSMTADHFPSTFSNVCEASGFFFLAPFLFAVAIREVLQRRFDPIFLICVGFTAWTLTFMIVGIPPWLAKWTGWSYVYPIRAYLALGVASIVALFRYLALRRDPREAASEWRALGLFIAVGVALLGSFLIANEKLGGFASLTSVIAAAAFFGFVTVCLWFRQTVAACLLLVAPVICANATVNPFARGLPGFTRSDIYQWFCEQHQNSPAAKWIVIGATRRGRLLSPFVKATGAEVVGGTRANPDAKMIAALDPQNKYGVVHNRYAEITLLPAPAGSEPTFELQAMQAYAVRLPLTNELFDQMGVRFVLEVDMPENEGRIAGFTIREEREDCRLLVRDDD